MISEKNHISGFTLFICVVLVFSTTPLFAQESSVGFTTTPGSVVEGMLDLADIEPSDYVIDLGSGDGRIVISAALRGALAHGVEFDPELISLSYLNAEQSGVIDRVLFLEEDFFETDFSMASVVTLYVLESTNIKLRPFLMKNLKPGSRVISHRYEMGSWEPDAELEVDFRKIYKWIIPADFSGNWKWTIGENEVEISVDQQFQRITSTTIQNSLNRNVDLYDVYVSGDAIRLVIKESETDTEWVYDGKIEGNRITGVVQVHENEEKRLINWEATRSD